LSLTDSGALFYEHATSVLEKADEAENAIRERLATPSGTIRFTTAVATSLFAIRYLLPDFVSRYPLVNVVQHTSDDNVDIVGNGYDLAIRAHTGSLSDSSLVQRVLASAPWCLFASAAYLDRRGAIEDPSHLPSHDTLLMSRPGMANVFKLSRNEGPEQIIPVSPRILTNDLVMLKQAAVDGLGVVALPAYVCREELLQNRLVRVLPEWSAGEAHITAIIPFRHGLLPAARVFIDYLVESLPRVTAI
jgi:DNA-binding transcriptional LysR family regulator